jgi:hypothetical protein
MSKVQAFVKAILVVPVVFLYYQSYSQTWDFVFPKHRPGEVPLLDLRYLNEKTAGEHGYIRMAADGNSFLRGDGTPIRFWPVSEFGYEIPDSNIQRHAHFLAQTGVNMVRYHVCLNAKGKGTLLYDFDLAKIRQVWRFIAAMKKEGIYATISPFWPNRYYMGEWIPEEWGLESYSGNTDLWGMFYFSDTLRSAYKTWTRAMYTLTNPFTGIALKDDPAVAIIEIMTEDGVFWWSMDECMTPGLKKLILKKYRQWLINRYGSVRDAFAAWGDAVLPGDSLELSCADIYSIQQMTLPQEGYKAIRIRDQVRFYAETQYAVYKEIYDFYRNELGCKQLINTMNWTAADAGRLLDLERWTNTAAEVIATNRYYDPGHDGENNGWRIDPGHVYVGTSALYNPLKIPLNIKQVDRHPFIITESGWNTPHKYMAEGPFLVAAYQSLTGLDGFYWFCITDEHYAPFPYFSQYPLANGQFPLHRWTCSLPGMLGQFPANALLFRQGYLKEGEPVIEEKKSFESLINRDISKICELRSYDPNRAEGKAGNHIINQSEFNPLAFLAGPVKVDFTTRESSIRVNDKLPSLINPKTSTVKSITGQHELNYSQGICKVNSPKAKGVCGFLLKAGSDFSLDGVRIKSTNEYAAVWIVSLDDKPLDQSKKILIQYGTKYLPTGWKEKPTEFVYSLDKLKHNGFKILNTGSMPWQADNTKASVEINNPQITRATLLDVAGYANMQVPITKNKGKVSVTLPPQTLYLILE